MKTASCDIFETMSNLKGKKATIFKYSDMGFAHSIPCEITNIYRKDYAQYRDLIHVDYRPKGKRTEYVWRIQDYCTFAVFAGHVALDTNMFVKSQTDSDGTTIRTSLLSFSEGYLDNALKSTSETPLLVQRNEVAEEVG